MSLLFTKIQTYTRLGFNNLLRVFLYRLYRSFRIGDRTKTVDLKTGPFFLAKDLSNIPNFEVTKSWRDKGLCFSFHEFEISGIPDWHANPFKIGVRADDVTAWHKISDFNDQVGDIKTVWEASRFDWVLTMAQRTVSGDYNELARLNNWLENWIVKNPPYRGVNWKCGQEASIRVMHLAMAVLIFYQNNSPSESLKKLIEIHLKRINSTMSYAIAQCNNHATSEAAALFIGGQLVGGPYGKKISKKGRRTLESVVQRLIDTDGTFSQYSLNYHRLMLDTLCMAEIWRMKNGEPRFCEKFYVCCQASSKWLINLINLNTGGGPNVGANDGARLLQLTNSKYGDFRPTVQLSYALFFQERAIKEVGPWDDCLKWLNIERPQKFTQPENSFLADKGGFVVLRNKQSMVLMRYPRFKFRPSHADALHVDLWVKDLNILRDGGTYSYNTESKWINYFSGIESHNTVQFDDLEQMPRISRFLFGNWLETTKIEDLKDYGESKCFGASYSFRKKTKHHRRISLSANRLLVNDLIKGFQEKAIVRWRLVPGEWNIKEVKNGFLATLDSDLNLSILVTSRNPFVRGELVQGWESLHYLEKTQIPVFEVETNSAGLIKTTVDW